METTQEIREMELRGKPDFEMAMRRVEAWFNHEMIDRPPVRFGLHNAEFNEVHADAGRWPTLKDRWFDAEYQVDSFAAAIRSRTFHGETFPVFSPNLGPNVYAAYFGAELEYGEVTSWIEHCIHDWSDLDRLNFSQDNSYFHKIEELTRIGLQKCKGQFMVGYTDLHGSLDCVADWRNPQTLCLDLLDNPEQVKRAVALADRHFLTLFDHYDALLRQRGQLSVTWMGIPSRGKMHIPSCDFTSMVSTEDFDEFYLPSMQAEIRHMTHNVFHLDGKGMIRHLDRILAQPEIHAVQWVQGVGDDLPIMQWLPVIKRIQAAGKGVVVDLQLDELEAFIANMKPEGLYLCLAAPEKDQPEILKRLTKW
jgi:hypothetical protein